MNGVAENNMQAVILAAGRGSRLNPDDSPEAKPKCLVDFNNQTLLEYQISTLNQVGIRRICIVVGYGSDKIAEVVGNKAHLVYNDHWAETNSLYSFGLCRDWVEGPMVVMNCDVLAHREIFHTVASSPGSSFAYDSSSGTETEHMKVELEEGYLKKMSKKLSSHRTMGENVGILRFDMEAGELLFQEGHAIIQSGGQNKWLASAVERIARHVPIRGIDIAGLPWIEIDFPNDLVVARKEIWPQVSKFRSLTFTGFQPTALLPFCPMENHNQDKGSEGTRAFLSHP